MVSNNLKRDIASREFDYGEHVIVVTVRMHHTYKSGSNVDYGASGRGYYRIVTVNAYPQDEYDSESDDNESDAFNSTSCQVRAEPYEPDIDVPDDPTLSIIDTLRVRFSDDITAEDIKESVRAKKRQMIREERVPSGPREDLETQIEDSVRPVLETVDAQYRVMNEDVEIDIDVSVERMAAEVSWVEVDDEMERITKELENISEM